MSIVASSLRHAFTLDVALLRHEKDSYIFKYK